MVYVVPVMTVCYFYFEKIVEVEMMKERFAKLLLGEDMSGGGKGVCTALAISNAITNLSGQYNNMLVSLFFDRLFVCLA